MSKVLLKHPGQKQKKQYQGDVIKISRIAFSSSACRKASVKMYSSEEIYAMNTTSERKTKKEKRVRHAVL